MSKKRIGHHKTRMNSGLPRYKFDSDTPFTDIDSDLPSIQKNTVWFTVRTIREVRNQRTVRQKPLNHLISCGFLPIFREPELAV